MRDSKVSQSSEESYRSALGRGQKEKYQASRGTASDGEEVGRKQSGRRMDEERQAAERTERERDKERRRKQSHQPGAQSWTKEGWEKKKLGFNTRNEPKLPISMRRSRLLLTRRSFLTSPVLFADLNGRGWGIETNRCEFQ